MNLVPKPSVLHVLHRSGAPRTPIDIIIPIHDAFEHTVECVRRVLKHTDPRHTVWLWDDASGDPRMAKFLKGVESARVKVMRSEINRGFSVTVNAAINATQGDVVLLNSDTLVGTNWLYRLERARDAHPDNGIVSPLFSDGFFLSFPDQKEPNGIPWELSFDEFAERWGHRSPRRLPEIPAGLGCCMLIRRAVFQAAGVFDEVFSPGYWEDIDFSMRARLSGFRIVCADDVYVFHHSAKSFGSARRDELYLKHLGIFRLFWPQFKRELEQFYEDGVFHEHKASLKHF